jgi:HSP90 family molecular chaperone
VEKYINQLAFSGAEEFLEKYKDSAKDSGIIGHFGLRILFCIYGG